MPLQDSPSVAACQPGKLFRLLTAGALAAFSLPALAGTENINGQLARSLMKTTAMLIVVIICILALTWLIKKLQYNGFRTQRSLEIIESLHLGRNEKLCIARVGSTYQVLGITANNITLLQTLDHPDRSHVNQDDSGQDDLDQEQGKADHPSWRWAQQLLKQRSLQQIQP